MTLSVVPNGASKPKNLPQLPSWKDRNTELAALFRERPWDWCNILRLREAFGLCAPSSDIIIHYLRKQFAWYRRIL